MHVADFRMRNANESDAEALLSVHRNSILKLGQSHYTAAECESWASGLTVDGYRSSMTSGEVFIVAEDDTGVVGFCSFKNDEVVGLYVHPNAARRQIGSALLTRAEKTIRADDFNSIRLNAALSALAFYQSHGYRVQLSRSWTTRGGLEITISEMIKNLEER